MQVINTATQHHIAGGSEPVWTPRGTWVPSAGPGPGLSNNGTTYMFVYDKPASDLIGFFGAGLSN
jgi:hypothetical protein